MLKAGLPVGAVTFAMVYWAISNGYLSESDNHAELQKQLKEMAKKKNRSEKKGGFLYQKWVKFGGGFYGVVALITYAVVEFGEIREFFSNFEGLGHFIDTISFGMLVNFFIESIMNFVTAISWPAYWINAIDSNQIWVWFVAAYLGYLGGSRLAGMPMSEE